MGQGIRFAIAILAFLPTHATAAFAAGPDRMGQAAGQITRLGQRLAPLAARHDKPRDSAAFWSDARRVIASSDAAGDARADAAAGHAGFVTHANDAIAERPLAPGVKCLDRSEPRRRAVFLFAYKAPLMREAGAALLAFDTYARRYNAHIIASGALGETSCRTVGW